jgi:multicomponent Na+:H+ antiporter subunit E
MREDRDSTPPDTVSEKHAEDFRTRRPFYPTLIVFIIMLVLWVILSGRFDAFHLGLGIISSFLVAYFSGDFIFDSPRVQGFFVSWIRFVVYIPWLLYQIFLANLHVLYLTFHPRMMELIDPKIFRFRSLLRGQLHYLDARHDYGICHHRWKLQCPCHRQEIAGRPARRDGGTDR